MCLFRIFIFGAALLSTLLGCLAKDWYETASVYQIYPRSFKDSDGDGIGDLKGVTQMLPYLKEIGIDAAWLSPVFKSPMADFGYDVSDFYSIQPEYGTLEDFDNLMVKAKEIGIKLLLDFVPNHTSDEHEWFIKSLRKEPGYEDFYVWHPGFPDPNNSSNRLPPTNWVSVFRFSAWKWREERQAFYLHQFHEKQPDLNYRNPRVVQEMKDMLAFWLRRGIDGFRVDAVNHLFEVPPDQDGNFPDEPLTGWTDDKDSYDYVHHIYTMNHPDTVDMIYQWRQLFDDLHAELGGDTKLIMTEAYTGLDVLLQYYGNATHQGSHIPFNFFLITDLNGNSNAEDFTHIVNRWVDYMPADRPANWVLGNHDQRRVASRYGVKKIDLLNMLLMILPGVSVNYNGEEIGMTDVWISWEDTVDPQACNTNPEVYERFSRDVARTPFQWDDTKNAGFSTGSRTWLPVGPNYRQVNVKTQRGIVRSTLNNYKRAKTLRKSIRTFMDGGFKIQAISKNILTVRRSLAGELTIIMVANVGSRFERFSLRSLDITIKGAKVMLTSGESPRRIGELLNISQMSLLPSEALYLQVTI